MHECLRHDTNHDKQIGSYSLTHQISGMKETFKEGTEQAYS